MEEDPLYLLVKEQLARIQDQSTARISHLDELLQHQNQLTQERVQSLQEITRSLRVDMKDHEDRLRSLTDSATVARTWQSLLSGAGFLTGIAALVRAFFGG